MVYNFTDASLALISYCKFLIRGFLISNHKYQTIFDMSDPVCDLKIMFVNPSHYRVICADNTF